MGVIVGLMVVGVFIGLVMWWLCLSSVSVVLCMRLLFGFMYGLLCVLVVIVVGFGVI